MRISIDDTLGKGIGIDVLDEIPEELEEISILYDVPVPSKGNPVKNTSQNRAYDRGCRRVAGVGKGDWTSHLKSSGNCIVDGVPYGGKTWVLDPEKGWQLVEKN